MSDASGSPEDAYREIRYEVRDGVARITIDRPERYNACTPVTAHEVTLALTRAWVDDAVGVVVLTGAGDKAFCTGGDQSIREEGGYQGTAASLPLEVLWQQVTHLIRTIPKPVIARVNGFAIGGGHVWHVCCDLSIASETAQFGQAGPRVGSFDPGYGTWGAGPGDRDEAGQGDLVPLPEVLRPGGPGHGSRQRGGPPRGARCTRSPGGARSCWRRARPRSRC